MARQVRRRHALEARLAPLRVEEHEPVARHADDAAVVAAEADERRRQARRAPDVVGSDADDVLEVVCEVRDEAPRGQAVLLIRAWGPKMGLPFL